MQELIPLIAGGLIGLLVSRLSSTRLKVALFVALCLLVGVAVSFFTGELAEWWGFFTFDSALVWLGGLIAVGAAEGWRRWAPSTSARR